MGRSGDKMVGVDAAVMEGDGECAGLLVIGDALDYRRVDLVGFHAG